MSGETSASGAIQLLGPAEIRELATALEVRPTKKLGQNFVIDPNTVRKIVKLAKIEPGDTVVEIGPGLGSLSLGIVDAGASLVAVELDSRLAAQLPATFAKFAPGVGQAGQPQLTVIHQDALTVSSLPEHPTRLVANLPYNISVPVLLHFLEHFASIRSGLVMVQAEVGYRLAAEPGSKVYGGPSAKAAWYGEFTIAGQVSRQIFWPVPNVDSVLVAFTRQNEEPGDEALRRQTFELIDAAFGQRRKMLRQALATALGSSTRATEVLERAGIDATKRGEQLSLADFVAIARAV